MAAVEALATSSASVVAAADNVRPQLCRRPLAVSWRLSSGSSPSSHAGSSLMKSPFLSSISSLQRNCAPGWKSKGKHHSLQVSSSALGEDPEWQEDDYIVLGLAHCFKQDEGNKLQDIFLVEPVSASSLECMENGGATCYLHVTATTLGTALKLDRSLLPPEFSVGQICDDFDFRIKCASRTWKRPHAVKNIRHLAPTGSVRSDFNFSLTDKRIINKEHVVTDADNIKQDLSIDVYGRSQEAKDEVSSEIASLYNA